MRRIYQLAILALLAARPAAAAPPSFVGGAGATLDDAALVSRAGEIYRKVGGVWRRQAGGVAADLTAVWGRSPAELVALGARAPAYRSDGVTWSSIPGGWTGAAILAARDAPRPGLAVDRRVFVLETGVTRWTTLPGAAGSVAALWTRGAKEAFAVIDGKLWRMAPGWRQVPLAELVVALGGVEPLALGADGGVYAIAGGRPRKLAASATLVGFRPRLVLGHLLVADDQIARVASGKVTAVGTAPTPGLAALLELQGGGFLAATRAGRVFSGKPGAWVEETVDAQPAGGDHRAAPPAVITTPPSSR